MPGIRSKLTSRAELPTTSRVLNCGDAARRGLKAECAEHDAARVHAERERVVLPDHANRLLAQAHGGTQPAEIVGRERNVRRLDGDVGSDRAHGNAHVGERERRRVVDAVAHHRHRVACRSQVLNLFELLIGQHAGTPLGHTHKLRH